MHGLLVRVRLQTGFSQLSSNPRLLHTPKRNSEIAILTRVDPNHSCFNLPRHTMSLDNIPRENRGSKTVRRIIRQLQRVFLCLKLDQHHKRPENFFLENLHLLIHVCEDRRGDEEAFPVANVLVRFAAESERRAFGFAGGDVGQHAVVLGFGDLRALECFVCKWVADFGGRGYLVFERGHEFVVDAFLDEDAGGGGADLALIAHDSGVGPFDCLVEIGVVEDEEGGFSACFEGDVFEVEGGHFHDFAAGGGAACEGDFVDSRVLGHGGAGDAAVAVEDVYYAWREAGFFDQVGEDEDAEGCLLSRFENDGVAAGERWAEFPGSHCKRVVLKAKGRR